MWRRRCIQQPVLSGSRWRGRPGQALVIVVLSFTALMAMAALVVDIGNLTLQQRSLNQIASGAALAAAQLPERNVGAGTGGPVVSSEGLAQGQSYADSRLAQLSCVSRTAQVVRLDDTGAWPPSAGPFPTAYPAADYNQYVWAHVTCEVPMAFARTFGVPSRTMTGMAMAHAVRPTNSSHALMAVGGGLNLSDRGLGGEVGIVGNVVSHSSMTRSGGSSATLRPTGFVAAADSVAAGMLAAGIIPFISPAVPVVLLDPIAEDLAARGITLPTFAGPIGGCVGTDRIVPYPNPSNPTEMINNHTAQAGECNFTINNNGRVTFPSRATPYGNVTIHHGGRAEFNRADYRDITILSENNGTGSAEFFSSSGSYRINNLIISGTAYLHNSHYMIVGNLILSSGSNNNAALLSDTGQNDGIYLAVNGNVTFTGPDAQFSIKGRPEYLDIGLYSPVNGRLVSLNNGAGNNSRASQLIGSVYAPFGTVELQGNYTGSPYHRVRRGGTLSERGGRVVASRIDLYADGSATTSPTLAAEYPSVANDYIYVPNLVPINPATP